MRISRGTPEAQSRLCVCRASFLMTFATGGAPAPGSHPLCLLPSIFPSIRVFPNESGLPIRWPKCWSFSSSISPSNEYSGLNSLRIDWFDLVAVQGKSQVFLAPQLESINSLALCLFLLYNFHIITGKTIALTIRTFVREVMSLVLTVFIFICLFHSLFHPQYE